MSEIIDSIKQKIYSSTILSENEKKEWLFLLPKMTPTQIAELEKLLEVRMPTPSPVPIRVGTTSPARGEEIKKEIPSSPAPVKDIQPALPPLPKEVEPLGLVSVSEMRKAPSIYLFLEELGKKMKDLAASGGVSRDDIRRVFEQSPLHRTYVSVGLKLMDGQESDMLSHAEFEALADFRESLRKTV